MRRRHGAPAQDLPDQPGQPQPPDRSPPAQPKPDPASRQWQVAVSRTVYLRKYLTKITSFSITPRHASKGGHLRVAGRLWADNGHGRWRPYGHRKVLVVFRYRGVWYRYRVEPQTSKAGWFSGRFPVYSSNSRYFSQYDGDKAHFACASTILR